MSDEQFQSAAFRMAELRSERLRIFGVLGFVAVFVGVTIVRVFVIRTTSGTSAWVWSLLLAAAIAAYEGWTLRQVDIALTANSSLPFRFWILSTIVETSIPAFALGFLSQLADRECISPPGQPVDPRFFYLHYFVDPQAESLDQRSLRGCCQRHLSVRRSVFGLAAPGSRRSGPCHPIQRKPECDNSTCGRGRRWRGGWANP